MRRTAAWSLFVVATTWAAAIVVAPRALVSASDGLVVSAAAFVYVASGLVCHQRPERSFRVGERALPVCGRCTGLYVGAPIGMALALGLVLWRRRRVAGATRGGAPLAREDGGSDRWWRGALIVAAVPTVLSLGLEWATGLSDNVSRALTAVPLGAAVGAFVIAVVLGRLRPAVPGLLHYRFDPGGDRHS